MSRDAFKVDGPTVISFSGGRTSAYLLWRVLQAHGGTLPADAVVCFQNTGKEMPETLDFVAECSDRWNVPIAWIEWAGFEPPGRNRCLWRVVDRATAATNGEPFAALCEALGALPNPVARMCTSYLKVKTMIGYLKGALGWDEWDIMLGLRADEPRRVARMKAPDRDNRGGQPVMPLAAAGVGAKDVGAFWKAQPFDLRLPNHGGKTMHGNCDLCFLKPAAQIQALIAEDPKRAVWWIEQERLNELRRPSGHTFRNDRPSYAAMADFARDQRDMFDANEEAMACFCGD
jgi:3'-phosphoadenosine 5'-phosphosulfate sulfotransferase (PAPS reductase)/FAD synthetase